MGETADQLRQLAGLYSAMSDTVDRYRTQHFQELAPEERLRLEELFQQLCDLHDELTSLAIADTLKDIQSDMAEIASVTGQAQQALDHIETVAEITTLVSAAVAVGTDLSVGDYGAVPQSLKDLVQALSRKPEQPATAK
jgi:hypothetical protein